MICSGYNVIISGANQPNIAHRKSANLLIADTTNNNLVGRWCWGVGDMVFDWVLAGGGYLAVCISRPLIL